VTIVSPDFRPRAWQNSGMTRDPAERRIMPALVTGFGLLLVVLLVWGWIAVKSMRFVETDASRFVSEQQATARLIGEVQSEEGDLSAVFYALATRQDGDRDALLKRIDTLESNLRHTIEMGGALGSSPRWNDVRRAAEAFLVQGRATLRSGRPPASEFYQSHQALLAAIADLAGSSLSPHSALQAERDRLSGRIESAFVLLGVAVLVALGLAGATVFLVNRIFARLRWQATELDHLSSRTMSEQEEAAGRLSREMHDHLGQTLSAIEANIVSMQNARAFHAGRLDDCLGLIKDAVSNVREVSQLLRPPILDDFGLDASLRWLADRFAERTGTRVRYTSSFNGRLDRVVETQLFRITQEALTNISRHSGATEALVALAELGNVLRLTVADNGKGMKLRTDSVGIGLVGMRARARVAGGSLSVESRPGEGVRISVEIPLPKAPYVPQNSHSFSR
jgi:signal transduction histidine kinase